MKKKAQEFAHDNMLPKFTGKDMDDLFKALSEERKIAQEKQEKENVEIIDERLRYLGTLVVGKDLTEEEQMAILDIVDEYTPKDKDGNYLCSLLPFDYAWEIYQIKNKKGG
jgi:hypothetical protein